MKLWFKFYLVICICSAFQAARGQSWQPFGNPIDTTNIISLFVDSVNNTFYMGGYIPNFNNINGNHVFHFDGNAINNVGSSFIRTGGGVAGPASLSNFNNQLVASGSWDSIGTRGFKMPVAWWDGLEWLPFDTTTIVYNSQGGSSRPHIDDMIVFENKLFVIGTFRYQDPIFPFSNTFWDFAYYDSSGWHCAFNVQTNVLEPLQPNFNVFNNELYIGGCIFYDTCLTAPTSGIQSAKGLARYNSQCQSIEYVGSGWGNRSIFAMVNLNGSMYIGFRGFHPTYGNNITRFDGTNFYPLGPGLNGEVQALTIYNGQLVAGGLFTSDGNNSQPLNSIAVWDGVQWNPFPGGCELNRDIYHLNVYDSILIASGNFDSCGVVHTGGSVIYPNGLTTLPETVDEPLQITVFPNPSDGVFQIHYNNENNATVKLEIVDCMGKSIFVQQLNEKSYTTEIKIGEFLTSGLYILRLISSNSIAQQKIIINRD